MSNRGQVWDHKSLLKPKSFSKSPLDRILIPDYKFMVAIIDRIVSCSIFRKICIFQEKIQSYSYQPQFVQIFSLTPTHSYRQLSQEELSRIRSSDSEHVADDVNKTVLYSLQVVILMFLCKNFETNQISTNRMRQNEIIDSFYCLDRLEIQSVQL